MIHHGARSRRVNLRNRRHISGLPRDPTPFIVSNILCFESISTHDCHPQIINIAFTLHQGLKRILSQVTGHRPEFQVLCRTTCVCVQHFCASSISSNQSHSVINININI